MACRDDVLVKVVSLLDMVGDWGQFLSEELPEEEIRLLRSHERTGRPLGSESFIGRLENTLGRIVRRQRPGRKPKQAPK